MYMQSIYSIILNIRGIQSEPKRFKTHRLSVKKENIKPKYKYVSFLFSSIIHIK